MKSNHNRRALWLGAILGTILAATPAIAADYTENFEKSYPVAPTVRVSLKNVNGSVEISTWNRNEVKVSATKRAGSQASLAETKIEVQASNGSVAIETKYPDHHSGWHNNNASVDYEVQVPKSARLDEIETVNGNVEISGVKGDVHASSVNGKVMAREMTSNVELSTVNGKLDCEMLDLGNARTVKLSTVNGPLDVSIPRDSNAHLTAASVHGGINSNFNLPIKSGFTGANLDTTLGSGSTQVELNTVNGPISIRSGSKGL
jgi:DUF4097 and DUF4098 domain-containing protein YvlB